MYAFVLFLSSFSLMLFPLKITELQCSLSKKTNIRTDEMRVKLVVSWVNWKGNCMPHPLFCIYFLCHIVYSVFVAIDIVRYVFSGPNITWRITTVFGNRMNITTSIKVQRAPVIRLPRSQPSSVAHNAPDPLAPPAGRGHTQRWSHEASSAYKWGLLNSIEFRDSQGDSSVTGWMMLSPCSSKH